MLGASLALSTAAALLLWLGARLWRTAATGAPERWLALAFAALGAGESGVLVVGLNAVSHFAIAVAIVGLATFVWRVFRPASRTAGACVGAVTLGNLVLTLWLSATAHALQEASALALAVNASRLVVLLLAFAECARYARLMRRRLALGLADPVVTNRFLLWGLVAICALVASGAPLVVGLLGGDSFNDVPTRIAGAAATIFGSVGLQLAFLPPKSYVRWLSARAVTA